MSEETTQNFPGGDLGRILALLAPIGEHLTALEDKVERRLQDTRPIWEQVLARLDAIESRLGNLEGKVESIETEMRRGFRRLDRQMSALAGDVIEVRVAQQDLESRMDKIEDESARR